MSRWSRKVSAAVLVLMLALGVGCSSDGSLTESSPTSAPQGAPPQLLLESLVEDLSNLTLLSCSPQPYAKTVQKVGTKGGTIKVGTHRLVIPSGALSGTVTITAEQVSDRVNSVRFSPEGLVFNKPASLTMSYANCSSLLALKRIVYTDELLRILELLPSVDNLRSKTVTGTIRHFSRYAVAW